jgi:hypothetical protein
MPRPPHTHLQAQQLRVCSVLAPVELRDPLLYVENRAPILHGTEGTHRTSPPPPKPTCRPSSCVCAVSCDLLSSASSSARYLFLRVRPSTRLRSSTSSAWEGSGVVVCVGGGEGSQNGDSKGGLVRVYQSSRG